LLISIRLEHQIFRETTADVLEPSALTVWTRIQYVRVWVSPVSLYVVAVLPRVVRVLHGPPAPPVLDCTRIPVTGTPFAGEWFVQAMEIVVLVEAVMFRPVAASGNRPGVVTVTVFDHAE